VRRARENPFRLYRDDLSPPLMVIVGFCPRTTALPALALAAGWLAFRPPVRLLAHTLHRVLFSATILSRLPRCMFTQPS